MLMAKNESGLHKGRRICYMAHAFTETIAVVAELVDAQR